jgi:hypothetical protein
MRTTGWRKTLMAMILAVALPLGFSGCGIVVVAGLGALGGYTVSRDTIEGATGYSEGELFETATEILSIMGQVDEKSKVDGRVLATVNGAKVTVTFIPVSKTTTTLRVKARRGMFPKIAVAQDVYMKIVRKLQE